MLVGTGKFGIAGEFAMSSMLRSGLLSITFRKLIPDQIVEIARAASIDAIEWGGDIHAPPGNIANARAIRRQCDDAGLAVSAYGSYYRAGIDPAAFAAVLETAVALGTDTIRVWAGTTGSRDATAECRATVAADLRRICASAEPLGITIATEFHGGTLTDDVDECLSLLRAVSAPNLRTFWQPPVGMETNDALATLIAVSPHLSNIHVFHWWPGSKDRQPLSSGSDRWREYLAVVKKQGEVDGRSRFASLEFVRGDSVEQFREDARTLISLLEEVNELV